MPLRKTSPNDNRPMSVVLEELLELESANSLKETCKIHSGVALLCADACWNFRHARSVCVTVFIDR